LITSGTAFAAGVYRLAQFVGVLALAYLDGQIGPDDQSAANTCGDGRP